MSTVEEALQGTLEQRYREAVQMNAARVLTEAQAELEAVRTQAAGAFDATAAAYEELKAKVPGPDHVVILKADYERLIASLPIRSVK